MDNRLKNASSIEELNLELSARKNCSYKSSNNSDVCNNTSDASYDSMNEEDIQKTKTSTPKSAQRFNKKSAQELGLNELIQKLQQFTKSHAKNDTNKREICKNELIQRFERLEKKKAKLKHQLNIQKKVTQTLQQDNTSIQHTKVLLERSPIPNKQQFFEQTEVLSQSTQTEEQALPEHETEDNSLTTTPFNKFERGTGQQISPIQSIVHQKSKRVRTIRNLLCIHEEKA